QERVEGVVQLQEVGQQHEQLVVAPPAHRPRQGRRQDRNLARRGEQVAAVGAVQRQRVRNVVLAEEALHEQREGVVVFQERRQTARRRAIARRQQRRELLAIAAQLAVAVGNQQGQKEQAVRQEERQGRRDRRGRQQEDDQLGRKRVDEEGDKEQ